MPRSPMSQVSRSRMWACIVTSSAVVSSSMIRSFGWFAMAMVMALHCHRPPDSSCGKHLGGKWWGSRPTQLSVSHAIRCTSDWPRPRMQSTLATWSLMVITGSVPSSALGTPCQHPGYVWQHDPFPPGSACCSQEAGLPAWPQRAWAEGPLLRAWWLDRNI